MAELQFLTQTGKLTYNPTYLEKYSDWEKFRYVMGPTQKFIDKYLEYFSSRESHTEFAERKNITPNPAYAKSLLLELRNNIYKCMCEITRIGGPETYSKAIVGLNGGVDRQNSSMNYFIGMTLLTELLAMGRVGVFVDRPSNPLYTRLDDKKSVPYIYMYTAEHILNWTHGDYGELTAILLRDKIPEINTDGLQTGYIYNYRLLQLTDNGVTVNILDANGLTISTAVLNLPAIPFAIAELSDSLLELTANYQIALLNIESSDISYTLRSNFPFYTEQFVPQARHFSNQNNSDGQGDSTDSHDGSPTGDRAIGNNRGRLYAKGLERPGFINPSSEPLNASMSKQGDIKATMRNLMHMSLANLEPVRASADSKNADNMGMSAGLSYIGLELERLETTIGQLWSNYSRSEYPAIKYPEEYDLRTMEERLAESDSLKKMINLPSMTYQKRVAEKIIHTLMHNQVSQADLDTMLTEIQASKGIAIDPEVLRLDVEAGLVDKKTASDIRLYPEGSAEIAKEEHIDDLKAIAIAQSPNMGAAASLDDPPRGADPQDTRLSNEDKKDPTAISGRKPVRGKGKSTGDQS